MGAIYMQLKYRKGSSFRVWGRLAKPFCRAIARHKDDGRGKMGGRFQISHPNENVKFDVILVELITDKPNIE